MTTNINADNGVVSGIAGLKTSADNSGVLALQTNGTTAVTVDASQNVGIGVTPSAWSVAYPNILQTEGGSIFGDPAGSEGNFGVNVYYNAGYKYAANGYVSIYQQYNAQHIFKTAVTGTAGNAVTLTNSLAFGKGTTLALEGATSNSGTGITFPATQNASANANTLDDYEEGTFTPTIYGTSTAGTTTYFQQAGTYTKIGRVVTVQIFLNITNQTGTGSLRLGGLPFTSGSGGNTFPCPIRAENLTLTAGRYPVLSVAGNATYINMEETATGGGACFGIAIDTSFSLDVTATYFV